MAASVADRDRAIRLLQESFIEGRLAAGEFEQRVGQALVFWDFRELLALTADLPVRSPFDRMPAHRITPRPLVRASRSRPCLMRVMARSMGRYCARRVLLAGLAPVLPAAAPSIWLLGFKDKPHHLVLAGIIAAALAVLSVGSRVYLYSSQMRRISRL
jgi:hypothetical protein